MKNLKNAACLLGGIAAVVLGIIGVIAFAIANPSGGFGFIDAFQHINGPKVLIWCIIGIIPGAIIEGKEYLQCTSIVAAVVLIGGIIFLISNPIGWMAWESLCIAFN